MEKPALNKPLKGQTLQNINVLPADWDALELNHAIAQMKIKKWDANDDVANYMRSKQNKQHIVTGKNLQMTQIQLLPKWTWNEDFGGRDQIEKSLQNVGLPQKPKVESGFQQP